jgi:hypothetical protein
VRKQVELLEDHACIQAQGDHFIIVDVGTRVTLNHLPGDID